MRRRYYNTVPSSDKCPQCGREGVRTAREIRNNYVCYSCTRVNEGPC